MANQSNPDIGSGDALLIVDMQNDFLPGGSLGVADGDAVIPVLNSGIERFQHAGLPIFASRDWHPADHCSFADQGGPWPAHCIAGSPGAQFASRLALPASVMIISKGTHVSRDAYSAFQETDLDERLRDLRITRLFVGGLATDYCVFNTVKDALRHGYRVVLLTDAIRAVNLKPDDGAHAEQEMLHLGAQPAQIGDIA